MTEYEVRLTAVLVAYVDVDNESEARPAAAELWRDMKQRGSELIDLDWEFDGTEVVQPTESVPDSP